MRERCRSLPTRPTEPVTRRVSEGVRLSMFWVRSILRRGPGQLVSSVSDACGAVLLAALGPRSRFGFLIRGTTFWWDSGQGNRRRAPGRFTVSPFAPPKGVLFRRKRRHSQCPGADIARLAGWRERIRRSVPNQTRPETSPGRAAIRVLSSTEEITACHLRRSGHRKRGSTDCCRNHRSGQRRWIQR